MELQRAVVWIIAVIVLATNTANAYTLTVYAKDVEENTAIDTFYAQLNDTLKSTNTGSITFENVSGSYTLTVWAENYAMAKYVIDITENTTITAYLTPLKDSWVVAFKVYRCFKPVVGIPVKVELNGNCTGSGYTDETGSIAFRLSKLRSYVVDVNNSEKVVTIQPVENNYFIVLPCNITGNATVAGYNISTGSYPFDLLTTAQNLSSQLSPSARGFISGLLTWLVMYGVSAVGFGSAIPGVLVLAGLAIVGFTDWIVVLICTLLVVAMHVLKGRVAL